MSKKQDFMDIVLSLTTLNKSVLKLACTGTEVQLAPLGSFFRKKRSVATLESDGTRHRMFKYLKLKHSIRIFYAYASKHFRLSSKTNFYMTKMWRNV